MNGPCTLLEIYNFLTTHPSMKRIHDMVRSVERVKDTLSLFSSAYHNDGLRLTHWISSKYLPPPQQTPHLRPIKSQEIEDPSIYMYAAVTNDTDVNIMTRLIQEVTRRMSKYKRRRKQQQRTLSKQPKSTLLGTRLHGNNLPSQDPYARQQQNMVPTTPPSSSHLSSQLNSSSNNTYTTTNESQPPLTTHQSIGNKSNIDFDLNQITNSQSQPASATSQDILSSLFSGTNNSLTLPESIMPDPLSSITMSQDSTTGDSISSFLFGAPSQDTHAIIASQSATATPTITSSETTEATENGSNAVAIVDPTTSTTTQEAENQTITREKEQRAELLLDQLSAISLLFGQDKTSAEARNNIENSEDTLLSLLQQSITNVAANSARSIAPTSITPIRASVSSADDVIAILRGNRVRVQQFETSVISSSIENTVLHQLSQWSVFTNALNVQLNKDQVESSGFQKYMGSLDTNAFVNTLSATVPSQDSTSASHQTESPLENNVGGTYTNKLLRQVFRRLNDEVDASTKNSDPDNQREDAKYFKVIKNTLQDQWFAWDNSALNFSTRFDEDSYKHPSSDSDDEEVEQPAKKKKVDNKNKSKKVSFSFLEEATPAAASEDTTTPQLNNFSLSTPTNDSQSTNSQDILGTLFGF